MITVEESIPYKSNAYNSGLDVFYTQFNDIFFYIEDENQENFFFCILKKLFPDIQLEKIFPLGGKDFVIEESKNCIGNRKKVFIVDKDYDDILDRIIDYPNLFYLDRYSIENYLSEKESLIEYIVEEKPRLVRNNIDQRLNVDDIIIEIGETLHDLVILFILVQIRCPYYKNISMNHERFVRFDGAFSLRHDQCNLYKLDVETELNKVDKRLRMNSQIKSIEKIVNLSSYDSYIQQIPGKFIMKMIKLKIERSFRLASRDIDSFNYRIAEKCSFQSLNYLQNSIRNYIN